MVWTAMTGCGGAMLAAGGMAARDLGAAGWGGSVGKVAPGRWNSVVCQDIDGEQMSHSHRHMQLRGMWALAYPRSRSQYPNVEYNLISKEIMLGSSAVCFEHGRWERDREWHWSMFHQHWSMFFQHTFLGVYVFFNMENVYVFQHKMSMFPPPPERATANPSTCSVEMV